MISSAENNIVISLPRVTDSFFENGKVYHGGSRKSFRNKSTWETMPEYNALYSFEILITFARESMRCCYPLY